MDAVVKDGAQHGVRSARAPFRRAVVVCGKCARKLGGEGFGRKGRQPLRKALKAQLKGGDWGRKVRLVETSCLGLCPKGRQVAATGGELEARRLLVISPGASATNVLTRLLGPPEPQAEPQAASAPQAVDEAVAQALAPTLRNP